MAERRRISSSKVAVILGLCATLGGFLSKCPVCSVLGNGVYKNRRCKHQILFSLLGSFLLAERITSVLYRTDSSLLELFPHMQSFFPGRKQEGMIQGRVRRSKREAVINSASKMLKSAAVASSAVKSLATNQVAALVLSVRRGVDNVHTLIEERLNKRLDSIVEIGVQHCKKMIVDEDMPLVIRSSLEDAIERGARDISIIMKMKADEMLLSPLRQRIRGNKPDLSVSHSGEIEISRTTALASHLRVSGSSSSLHGASIASNQEHGKQDGQGHSSLNVPRLATASVMNVMTTRVAGVPVEAEPLLLPPGPLPSGRALREREAASRIIERQIALAAESQSSSDKWTAKRKRVSELCSVVAWRAWDGTTPNHSHRACSHRSAVNLFLPDELSLRRRFSFRATGVMYFFTQFLVLFCVFVCAVDRCISRLMGFGGVGGSNGRDGNEIFDTRATVLSIVLHRLSFFDVVYLKDIITDSSKTLSSNVADGSNEAENEIVSDTHPPISHQLLPLDLILLHQLLCILVFAVACVRRAYMQTRAFVLYELSPYDKSFWRLLVSPTYWILTAIGWLPVPLLSALWWLLLYCWKDRTDMHQLADFIVSYSVAKFFSYGIYGTVQGAIRYFLCTSFGPQMLQLPESQVALQKKLAETWDSTMSKYRNSQPLSGYDTFSHVNGESGESSAFRDHLKQKNVENTLFGGSDASFPHDSSVLSAQIDALNSIHHFENTVHLDGASNLVDSLANDIADSIVSHNALNDLHSRFKTTISERSALPPGVLTGVPFSATSFVVVGDGTPALACSAIGPSVSLFDFFLFLLQIAMVLRAYGKLMRLPGRPAKQKKYTDVRDSRRPKNKDILSKPASEISPSVYQIENSREKQAESTARILKEDTAIAATPMLSSPGVSAASHIQAPATKFVGKQAAEVVSKHSSFEGIASAERRSSLGSLAPAVSLGATSASFAPTNASLGTTMSVMGGSLHSVNSAGNNVLSSSNLNMSTPPAVDSSLLRLMPSPLLAAHSNFKLLQAQNTGQFIGRSRRASSIVSIDSNLDVSGVQGTPLNRRGSSFDQGPVSSEFVPDLRNDPLSNDSFRRIFSWDQLSNTVFFIHLARIFAFLSTFFRGFQNFIMKQWKFISRIFPSFGLRSRGFFRLSFFSKNADVFWQQGGALQSFYYYHLSIVVILVFLTLLAFIVDILVMNPSFYTFHLIFSNSSVGLAYAYRVFMGISSAMYHATLSPFMSSSMYWVRVTYGLLSFPFLIFKVPLVMKLYVTRMATGYDQRGLTRKYTPVSETSSKHNSRITQVKL